MFKPFGAMIVLAAAISATNANADVNALFRAFDYSDITQLEELASKDPDPDVRQVSNILALTVRHRDTAAFDAMRKLDPERLDSRLACAVMLNKAMLYERQEDHKQVQRAISKAIEMYPGCAGQSVLDTAALHASLELVPEMQINSFSPGSVTVDRDTFGRPHIAVGINGVEQQVILDTGASFPTVSESVARHLRLEKIDGSTNTATATRSQSQVGLGLAKNLQVGNAVFENVVFLILPDASVKTDNKERDSEAILGLSVLLKLGRIEFQHDQQADVLKYGHVENELVGAPNMILHWLQPYVLGTVDQKWPVRAFLDTGAQDSLVTPLALTEYPELAEGALKAVATYSGVGGTTEHTDALVIPDLDLQINKSSVHFHDIVSSGLSTTAYHLLLGQGAFLSAKTTIIDFDNMYFDILQ